MSNSVKIVTQDVPAGVPGTGSFAARRGDRLTAEDVEARGLSEYVVGADSKEGRAITAEFFPEYGDQKQPPANISNVASSKES